ncbi:MAG: imidazole glycerol phosphate synthase subunit HisH [Gammaproteobacteria bacterium]|nr:imidazole glycerol phosphate synthase subunit HisH [Gammaproteobacteria bacterium]
MPGAIVIVDYGSSNLRSVARALEHVAAGRDRITVSDRAEDLIAATRIVFPGQGAIGDCMRRLHELNLLDTLRRCAVEKPFLGICLGLQSLFEFSDEDGGTAGLGLIAGRVERFAAGRVLPDTGLPRKIPHMGWNRVDWTRPHPLTEGIASGERFYFVHSYHVVPRDVTVVAAYTDYVDRFVSAVSFGTVFATQFHPEKSQAAGLRLLRNFLDWQP